MSQLQSHLDEGIRTDAALLNQALPKVSKGDNVTVHVICQSPGHCQGALDGFLALEKVTDSSVSWSFSSYLTIIKIATIS